MYSTVRCQASKTSRAILQQRASEAFASVSNEWLGRVAVAEMLAISGCSSVLSRVERLSRLLLPSLDNARDLCKPGEAFHTCEVGEACT